MGRAGTLVPTMDFGTVNFEDLFDFSPEPLDSREAEVQRQNETGDGGFLSGFSGTSSGRTSMVGGGGEGDAYQQRVKQGDGGGWAGGGGDGGQQQYSHSIGIPQGVIMKTEQDDNWENANPEDTLSKSLESAKTARYFKSKIYYFKPSLLMSITNSVQGERANT